VYAICQNINYKINISTVCVIYMYIIFYGDEIELKAKLTSFKSFILIEDRAFTFARSEILF